MLSLPKPIIKIIIAAVNEWSLRGVCKLFRELHSYRFSIGDFFPLCRRGTIEVLEDYLNQFPNQRYSRGAMVSMRVDVIKLFIKRGRCITSDTYYNAAKIGNLPVVKFLYDKFGDINFQAISAACHNGHFNVFEFLLPMSVIDTMILIYEACVGGNMKIIKILHETLLEKKIICQYNNYITIACENGHFNVIEYFMQFGGNRCESCEGCDDGKCPMTIKNGK